MFCPLSIDWGNVAQWVSGIAATLAVLYALFRDNISHYWKKPKLKFIEIIKTRQNSIWIYRLVIKNDSNHLAKNVEIDIEEVIDDGTKRNNFLPAPLSWTHSNTNSHRDIFPHQIAYLDIVTISEKRGVPIALYAPVIWSIPDMIKIEKGMTILKLKFYTENGKTGKIDLQVKWNGELTTIENNLPEITIKK